MNVLRQARLARWLVMSLLAVSLAVLPPLRMACACADCGASHSVTCCSPVGSEKTCCCAAGGCSSHTQAKANCCQSEVVAGCQCSAGPADREPAQVPAQHSSGSDLIAGTTLHADWQLPAVVPTLWGNYYEADFGPRVSGPSLQIAFCTWRN